jgi:lysozyme
VIRELLKADLRESEGTRDRVYDDATGHPIGPGSQVIGHPTVGVGHRVDQPQSPMVIDVLLEADIDAACHALDHELPWWRTCSESQQRALVELTFNLGMAGLLTFAHFLVHLRTGHTTAAGCELATSKWAEQVGPIRAQRLIQQVQRA